MTTYQIDLATATNREKQALEIALGVLRSDTDYADFLSSWLEDYGRPLLSSKPPVPLLPEEEWTDVLPVIIDSPNLIQ